MGLFAAVPLTGCIGEDAGDRYRCRRTPIEHFDTSAVRLSGSRPGGPEMTQGKFDLEPGSVDRIDATVGGETKTIEVDDDESEVTLDWNHGENVENLTVTYVAYRDGEELGRATMRNNCERG